MASGKYEKNNPLADVSVFEGEFFSSFLPNLNSVCVKAYVYMVYLCTHENKKITTVSKLAQAIGEQEADVVTCLDILNKMHLINYTVHPFSFEICSAVKAKELESAYSFDALNAYSDYFAGIRALLPGRSISPSEYDLARDWIELYGFSVEAALLLISHCIEIKDNNISFKYIDSVALSWANDGITNSEAAEEYITLYQAKHHDAAKLLLHLGIKRVPTAEEVKLYRKWTGEMGFDYKAIIAATSETTKTTNPTFAYIDKIISTLHSLGLTDQKQIKAYLTENSAERRTVSAVLYELGARSKAVSGAHIEALRKYKEFSAQMLIFIAKKCSAIGYHSFNKYLEFLQTLVDKQLFDENKIIAFFESKPEHSVKNSSKSSEINRGDDYGNVYADVDSLEV